MKKLIRFRIGFCVLGVIFFNVMVQAGNGFDNPVGSLPDDNLLTFNDAWFRDASGMNGGWSNWVNVGEDGSLSQGANKNPSPDAHDGTAVQWDKETGCDPLEDCISHLVVSAPQPHNILKFSWWNVVIQMDLYQVAIYGCQAQSCHDSVLVSLQTPDKPGPVWAQDDEVRIPTAVSYPYYQLEITCRYKASAQVGCKATGIYLAVAQDNEVMPPTPTATVKATAVPTETPDPVLATPIPNYLPIIKSPLK